MEHFYFFQRTNKFVAVFLLSVFTGLVFMRYSVANEDLSIGRMRVAIWPEYDDPSVLVIYDGKLDEDVRFPVKTSFLIPKGAVISDACSLSFSGQHFCQLYKTINRGAFDEVRLLLPYPNFYLSFHSSLVDTKNEKRAFDYKVKANHSIKTMEVDIQQPLRTTEFKLLPAGAASSIEKDFTHFRYTFGPISAGEEKAFKVSYLKKDQKPSVDIKYSAMNGPKVFGSPYDTQKNVKTIILILFGTGIAGVSAVVWFLFRKKKNLK